MMGASVLTSNGRNSGSVQSCIIAELSLCMCLGRGTVLWLIVAITLFRFQQPCLRYC